MMGADCEAERGCAKTPFARNANGFIGYGFDFIVSLPFASCLLFVAPILASVRALMKPF